VKSLSGSYIGRFASTGQKNLRAGVAEEKCISVPVAHVRPRPYPAHRPHWACSRSPRSRERISFAPPKRRPGDIRGAAGRERNDQLDRPIGISGLGKKPGKEQSALPARPARPYRKISRRFIGHLRNPLFYPLPLLRQAFVDINCVACRKKHPRHFFKPLAIGAPEPMRELPVRLERMVHFVPPHIEKTARQGA